MKWIHRIAMSVLAATILLTISVVTWQWWDELSLKEGIVVDKHYTEGWTQVDTYNGRISTTHYPATWTVTIEGIDPGGIHKQRTVLVSSGTYETLKIGDKWSVR